MTQSNHGALFTPSDWETLHQMIADYRAGRQVAETSAPLRDGVLPTYETLTPTSELLAKAAWMVSDLMAGQDIADWGREFVRELYDRAAAFKRCEIEGVGT